MNKKFEEIKKRFEILEADLQNPAVINDAEKLRKISQEYSDMKPVAEKVMVLMKLV